MDLASRIDFARQKAVSGNSRDRGGGGGRWDCFVESCEAPPRLAAPLSVAQGFGWREASREGKEVPASLLRNDDGQTRRVDRGANRTLF